MLSELLGSTSRARILAMLVVAPEQGAHLRELVRAVGGSSSSVQRELVRLEDMGLVKSERDDSGRRHVTLVAGHPFAAAVSGLVAADPRAQYRARATRLRHVDTDVAEMLGGIVDAVVLGFDPIEIVLFGSHARGTADADSDIDVLVVLPEVVDDHAVSVKLRSAIGALGVGVDVIATDPRRIEVALTRMDSVVRDAIEQGVILYERSA